MTAKITRPSPIIPDKIDRDVLRASLRLTDGEKLLRFHEECRMAGAVRDIEQTIAANEMLERQKEIIRRKRDGS